MTLKIHHDKVKGCGLFIYLFTCVFTKKILVYFKKSVHADLAMLARLTTALALKLAVRLANQVQ